MRLIKMAVYAFLGYVLYELFLGISENSAESSRGRNRSRGNPGNQDGRSRNMSGPADGETVETHDATGMSARHNVGRGVVHR
jgi:hypothetical protein